VPRNKVSGLKVSPGEFRDEISLPTAILLSNDIRRELSMLLPPRKSLRGGHVYVDDNTLHVQSGVSIMIALMDCPDH